MRKVKWFAGFLAGIIPVTVLAQNTGSTTGVNAATGSNSRAIVTAVPFLTVTPDSRSGSMGDAGVALSPDVNATYWNPSKLAFIDNNNTASASYSPWLRRLIPDVSLSYLSFAHRIDDRNAFGVSMRYFNLGSIQLVDANQQDGGTYTPNEFSIDGSFARKFGNNFSLGLTFRYIHSALYNGAVPGSSQPVAPVNDVATDVSMYYKKPGELFGRTSLFAFGADISNIGPRINYTTDGPKFYLPMNLKIGAANTIELNELSKITVTLDINKLLVPTPPIRDTSGAIIKGKNDDSSIPSAIFGSFTDAPGGFKEELQELTFSPGAEYWYNNLFALRAGYFYENPNKGGRKYATMGVGIRYDMFNVDFSYIAASQQNSPLANTLRFSVIVNFGASHKKDE